MEGTTFGEVKMSPVWTMWSLKYLVEVLQRVGYSSLRSRKEASTGLIHIWDIGICRWTIPEECGLKSEGFGGHQCLGVRQRMWILGGDRDGRMKKAEETQEEDSKPVNGWTRRSLVIAAEKLQWCGTETRIEWRGRWSWGEKGVSSITKFSCRRTESNEAATSSFHSGLTERCSVSDCYETERCSVSVCYEGIL